MNDIRIGFGYDFHKLIEGDSLKLADVRLNQTILFVLILMVILSCTLYLTQYMVQSLMAI